MMCECEERGERGGKSVERKLEYFSWFELNLSFSSGSVSSPAVLAPALVQTSLQPC